MSVDDRLAELGIELPTATAPVANYVMTRRSGVLLFVSGHLGKGERGVVVGRLGDSVTVQEGRSLARATAIDVLASVRQALGSLDGVRAVVKLGGYVNSTSSFTEQPAVVDGASEVMVEVFGEDAGRHSRVAVGVAQLPLGAAFELEAIFEVD